MEVVAVMHLCREHTQHSGMFSNGLASVGLSAHLIKPYGAKRADSILQSSYSNKDNISSVKLLPMAISL